MKLSTAFMTETFISAIKALPLTLSLALVPFLFGSVFAFLLALAQIKQVRFWGKFASFYVSLIRGMPMVVLVLLLYNTLPGYLDCFFKAIGSSFNVYRSIPGVVYAYFIFTLSAIAFLTEVFRSAVGDFATLISSSMQRFVSSVRRFTPSLTGLRNVPKCQSAVCNIFIS